MFAAQDIVSDDKATLYRELCSQLEGLLQGEADPIANAANTSALVFQQVPNLNWAGFYFLKTPDELVLGPFQGKPACVRIARGRGVCGAAALSRQTQVVPDVNAFPDHIFCDGASLSEIVVPLVRADGSLLGVWDVDSPSLARFDDEDRTGMEALCAEFMRAHA